MAMSESLPGSKTERKKARRRQRRASEREAGKTVDRLADDAVEQALALAPAVADAPSREESERAVDVEFPTVDAARFALRRVNEALAVGEWLDVVDAWVWERDVHQRPPLTVSGAATGVELRLEQPRLQ